MALMIPSTAMELRLKLSHEIRIIIASQDASSVVRRDAVTKLLGTVAAFVDQWESESSNRNDEFPSGVVREALSTLVFHIGQGDSQLRDFILQQLANSAKSEAPRQLFLDFLPSAMPIIDQGSYYNGQSSRRHTSTSTNADLEATTKQVIESLRAVLAHDSSALIPVIGCLSSMPLIPMGKHESFQLALKSLEFVSETDLPILVRALLKHAETKQNAVQALEALRLELVFIEQESQTNKSSSSATSGNDAITMVAHVVLNALVDDVNGNLVAQAYVAVLERIAADLNDNTSNELDKESGSFVMLDLMVILSCFQHPEFVDNLERLMDSMLQQNQFPFALISNLMQLIGDKQRHGRPTCILYPRLIQPLVSFSVFLILTPARVKAHNGNDNLLLEVMKQTKSVILELHHMADRDVQAELVHLLLQLSDKVASSSWSATTARSRKRPRSWMGPLPYNGTTATADGEEFEGFQVTIADTVNVTLQALARTAKQSFSNLKHVLVGRLTCNVRAQSTQRERDGMRHLCGIISALCEPAVTASLGSGGGNSGIQATEIMILLQKLLFASSYTAFASTSTSYGMDNRRVVRGLILATELVKSPCLSHGDWDCVKQWVLKILLPTTRRMVEPEIGSPGLAFLEAMMIDRERNNGTIEPNSLEKTKESFEHMKMVLANTGLIQILTIYQQQLQDSSRREPAILAYTASPPDIFLTQSAKKRKSRQMVFCLSFFLRNSDIYMPSRWCNAIEWVFRLVETYLRIGRTVSLSSPSNSTVGKEKRMKRSGSNKWVPYGWLRAAIEFPALVLDGDFEAENDKQRDALDWAKAIFSGDSCDPSTSHLGSTRDAASAGMCDLLLKAEDLGKQRQVVETIMRLGLSSLLGIALSFAVVRNAYAHIQSFGQDQDNDRVETLRLIQFQMFKIYDMRRKSESVERLLGAALLWVQKVARRIGKDPSNARGLRCGSQQKSDPSIRTANSTSGSGRHRQGDDCNLAKCFTKQLTTSLHELQRLRRKLFTSQAFLSLDVLRECVADKEQSKYLREAVEMMLSRQSLQVDGNESKLLQLISVRQCLLDHMVALCSGHSSTGEGSEKHSVLAPGVAHFAECVDFGLHLSADLRKLQKASHSLRGDMEDGPDAIIPALSSLAVTYLKYVCVVFANESNRQLEMAASQGQNFKASFSSERLQSPNGFIILIEACSDVFGAKSILNEEERDGSRGTTFAFAGFLLQLHSCHDAEIAHQLLEILSVLGLSGSDGPSTKQVLNANWQAMHTVYSLATETNTQSTLPYATVACLRAVEHSIVHKKSIRKCLRDTVLKLSVGRHDAIRQSLLRHMGLIALSPDATEVGVTHLLKVFEELSLLVGALDDRLGGETGDFGEEKKDDDGNRSTAGKSRDCVIGGIPDLHPASFRVVFVTLLHISVAGMAVLSLSRPAHPTLHRAMTVFGTKESGPYQRFQKLLVLFGSLLELYEKKSHLFPRRVLQTIFTATKHMLAMTVKQLKDLVEWRNAQPLLPPSERAKGSYDQGDTCYLEGFIKVCWTNVVSRPLEFCEYVKLRELEPVSKPYARRQKRKEEVESRQSKTGAGRQRKFSTDDEDHSLGDDEGDESHDDNKKENGQSEKVVRSRRKVHAKANSLRRTIQNAARVFINIASVHNLATSDLVSNDTTQLVKRKQRGDEEEGFHQLDGSSKIRDVMNVLTGSRRQRKKRRRLSVLEELDRSDEDIPTSGDRVRAQLSISEHNEKDSSDSDGASQGSEADFPLDDPGDDDSAASDDGSFCANGNWGEEESQANSSSGSLGLELETPIFS